jgi:pyridoxal phosphate enzyme (YggS family)
LKSVIKDRLELIWQRIRQAAERCGRNPQEIKLVAVSKTHPAAKLKEAISAGQLIFGENRVQEAEPKINEIGKAAEWHLIGHLQSNKARRAVRLFDVIESVDSLELASRLDRICKEVSKQGLQIFLEVNVGDEKQKSGVSINEAEEIAKELARFSNLRFSGLMTIPPFFEDVEKVRPFFKRLRELRDHLSKQNLFYGRGELSMGMSSDFEIAIEEGATLVRIGTAIFGERQR